MGLFENLCNLYDIPEGDRNGLFAAIINAAEEDTCGNSELLSDAEWREYYEEFVSLHNRYLNSPIEESTDCPF